MKSVRQFLVLISIFLISITQMNAQIDRSQPKPGPAPQITIKEPVQFVLKNGLKVLVVEDHKLPKVTFNLTLDNTPDTEGELVGVDDLLGSMLGNGTQKIPKDKFIEEIDFLGAEIDFYSAGASAHCLSKYSARVLELLSQGALEPLLTQEEFDKEKAKHIEGLKAGDKNIKGIADRVQNALLYGKKHPFGEFTTEESINKVKLQDVLAHYKRYFVPENAYLIVVGDVDVDQIKKQANQLFDTWAKKPITVSAYKTPKNVTKSEINIIDVPHAVQSEIAVLNCVELPMSSPDYFAGLLANQILGGGGEGRLFLNLREKHGWTYGAYSGLHASKYVSKFKASTSVRNTVTDSAVVEILNEIKKIRLEKVSEEDLKNAKAKYIGNFVMGIEKPETVARHALNVASQSLPKDFYVDYIKNIERVTPEQIQAVAQKYFMIDNLRITVTGKASDISEGLEKLNLPVTYFDKYANQTVKPEKKVVSNDISVATVFQKYFDAIGGKTKLEAIHNVKTVSSSTIQGMAVTLKTIVTSKNQMVVDLQMMGNSMMKQVYNDGTGFISQQGKKDVLYGDMLEEMKESAYPFPELNYEDTEWTLKGIESFEGKEVYVLDKKGASMYFDRTTGLKLGEKKTQEIEGQTVEQLTVLDDYRDVKGVKYPFKKTMNVGIEMVLETKTIEVNTEVLAKDFE